MEHLTIQDLTEHAAEKTGKRELISAHVDRFKEYLLSEERSSATIEKYMRDVRSFMVYIDGATIDKETVVAYKAKLRESGYKTRSINSMLSSLNSLFAFLGWHELRVKTIKIQRQIYCPEEKELTRSEYEHIVAAARAAGNTRLALIIQTICGTGIRVSELPYITVEAVVSGEAEVNCKGKSRTVFIVRELRKKLLSYASEQGITSGPVFVTRSGRPVSRTNIWRDMKALCFAAGVNPSKVFPHNLRHLFARVFYGIEKDIVKLADILGHSSVNTTRIYIISTGSEHRQRMESMRLII